MGDNPAFPHGGAHEGLMARVDTSVPVSARGTVDPPAVPALDGIGRKP